MSLPTGMPEYGDFMYKIQYTVETGLDDGSGKTIQVEGYYGPFGREIKIKYPDPERLEQVMLVKPREGYYYE